MSFSNEFQAAFLQNIQMKQHMSSCINQNNYVSIQVFAFVWNIIWNIGPISGAAI
jgi:hypothetical protein